MEPEEPVAKKARTDNSDFDFVKEGKKDNVLILKNEEGENNNCAEHDAKVTIKSCCDIENDSLNNVNVSSTTDTIATTLEESNTDITAYHPCEAELRVGIFQLINKHRFSGIIKQRFSDFVVRECDKSGKLVYLTNLDHIDKATNSNDKKLDDCITAPECPITDSEQLVRIEEFASSEDKSKKITLSVDDNKEHRKLVHVYIKSKYKHIETETVTLDNNSRAVELSFKSNRQGKVRRLDRGSKKIIPKYCHFVLFKQNKDTMECISLLGKMLKINVGNFAYAGTKDKRATTIQNISVQNTLSQRLQGLNKRLRNIALGNFSYAESGLSLGDLTGNEFTIIIRDVIESEADIERAIVSLRDKGFINYFGLQRFGTGAVSTHDIGKALLSSKFGEACDMILQPREETDNNNLQNEAKAQKVWTETKDPKKAFAEIRQKYSIEGKLLDGLCKRGNKNFLEAFKSIPRNTRLMYLHSYQSLVWNKVVSKRIEEYGFRPEVGDLVLKDEKDENRYQQVHIITDEDVRKDIYNIFDIVLPLPGYDMKYPWNKLYDYYKELLELDGLDLHDMRRPQKELSLSGKYRNIVTKPSNTSWECVQYNDYTIPLIENDFDRLNSTDNTTNGNESSRPTLTSVNGVENGKHKAIRFKMTLPTSCYATAALRELLTIDSSYQAQKELNKKFSVK